MKLNKKQGITLIVLVISIIVLLVLTGVTLKLMESSGLLSKASLAVDETDKQVATEKINLKITTKQMDSYAENRRMPTLQELADYLSADEEIQYVVTKKEEVGATKIVVGDAESIFTKLKKHPYEFEIARDLTLASIDGVQIADGSGSTEEYGELKTLLEQLQARVGTLEASNVDLKTKDEENRQKITENEQQIQELSAELALANQKISSAEEQIDNMLTTLDVDTRTTLFEGTAGTKGATYEIEDITDYKYIIVYANRETAGVRSGGTSVIINVSDIIAGKTLNYVIGSYTASTHYYYLNMQFKSTTQLYIGDLQVAGVTNPWIYKIEGIK